MIIMRKEKTMSRYKVVAIRKDSAHYEDRHKLVGEVVTPVDRESFVSRGGGWYWGWFAFRDYVNRFFVSIRLKKVK